MSTKERYYRISPRYWQESKGWPEDARWLGAYLTTCSHRNLTGLFHCPMPYLETDLRWSCKRLRVAFDWLLDKGYIAYDPGAEVLLLTQALADDPPQNENQRKGAIRALKGLPPSKLLETLVAIAGRVCPTLAEDIANAFETVSQPFFNASDTPSEPTSNAFEIPVPVPVPPPVPPPVPGKPSSPLVTPERVAELWNEICGEALPRVMVLTEKRRQAIKARLRAGRDRDEPWWRDYLSRFPGNGFLTGGNDRGWRASLDFAVRSEDVVAKVMEGQYDRKEGGTNCVSTTSRHPGRAPGGAVQGPAAPSELCRGIERAFDPDPPGLEPDRRRDTGQPDRVAGNG